MRAKAKPEGYPIPGCPGYTLTKDFKVYNDRTGKFLRPYKNKRSNSAYTYYVIGGSLRRTEKSLARIAYAVYRNIDIYNIPAGFVIQFKDGKPGFDNFVIRERSEVTRETNVSRVEKRNNADIYRRCYEFTGLVLSGDVTGLYRSVNKYRDEIIKSMSAYVGYKEAVEKYPELVSELICGILDGRYNCCDPVSYIKKYLRRTSGKFLPFITPPPQGLTLYGSAAIR
jgi:hypothetical protein